MHRTTSWLARMTSILVGVAIVFTMLLAGPAPSALADGPETTLFRAEFDSAPLGPISSPLSVEKGSVVLQAGTVTIASGPTGRALKLDGSADQATALMQWSNYPGAIPVNSQGTLTVPLPSTFNVATLNQLQFQAPSGSGSATADHLIITFKKGEGKVKRPAVIVIRD